MRIDNRSSTSRPRQIDQQRFKYYSAIKTGFSHMEDVEEADLSISAYLQAPTHVVDDECFVIPLPLMLREAGEKQNSFVMVFSIWHTMIGTAIGDRSGFLPLLLKLHRLFLHEQAHRRRHRERC
jgi:hypothetical protein